MGGSNPWRIAAALTLIALLAAVLVWQIFDWSSEDLPAVDEATFDTPAPIIVTEEEVWVESAQDALDGWARFASSGDLGALDRLIDPDGPQYEQLLGEASTLEPGDSEYRFKLGEASTEMRDGFPVVSGIVTLTVDGEPFDEIAWDIYLVERSGAWLLWTVEER